MKFAGINIGYGHTKLRTPSNSFTISSVVAKPSDTFGSFRLFAGRDTAKVILDGVTYEVGDDATLISPNPEGHKVVRSRWGNSLPYWVLRQLLIDRLALEQGDDNDWTVVLGMAVNQFTDDAYVKSLTSQWIGSHTASNGQTVQIRDASFVPEPVGAYWATVLSNPDLKQSAEEGTVLTIDGGYFTLDWAVITAMALVSESCGAVNNGMYKIVTTIQRELKRNGLPTFDLVRIESACAGKKSLYDGRTGDYIDINPYLQSALDDHVPQALASLANACDGILAQNPSIILTGGSASLLRPYVEQGFPGLPVFIPNDPQMANAEGYYLMAQTLAESDEEA